MRPLSSWGGGDRNSWALKRDSESHPRGAKRGSSSVHMMSAAAPHAASSAPETNFTDAQSKMDAALFEAVNIADSAKVIELIKVGANPTSQQKKGRTGTTHALLVAVQNVVGDGSSDTLVPALLSGQNVRCSILRFAA